MKLVKHFKRQVKTSRQYVFENILDLEHVCVLHKRWFSHLRIILQESDYVEYRLLSSFYGAKLDTLVRGKVIDENRYWYEFNTKLSKIRVEGTLTGADGNLMLDETISFNYHWILFPVFLILSPLFQKQKEDILRDDTQLLERVYKLNQKGFKRFDEDRPKVVVYGGTGFFGRLVVQDLLDHSNASVIIASRQPKDIQFKTDDPTRVKLFISDIEDIGSIVRVIQGTDVVISCLGPFQGQSLSLIKACIDHKINYVDVADDRDFLIRAHQLKNKIDEAGIQVFIGCSVIPGISSLLTRYSLDNNQKAKTVRIFITPGTRYARGPGSFACLLATLGQSFCVPWKGSHKAIQGWTGREKVLFPPPINKRWVYFVVDSPDYHLQPFYFNSQTVEFKIGAEFDYLNQSLAFVNKLKSIFGIKTLNVLIPLFRKIIGFAGLFGTTRGGVMVEVSPEEGNPSSTITTSVYTGEHGEVIPAILPSIATQMILKKEILDQGIVSLAHWLPKERFIEEFNKRDINVSCRNAINGDWTPISEAEEKLNLNGNS
jgi:hypothetical protein